VSIYSDKKIAAELPPNFEISAAIFCRRRFIKIARTDYGRPALIEAGKKNG
jgi:hypothetical protein